MASFSMVSLVALLAACVAPTLRAQQPSSEAAPVDSSEEDTPAGVADISPGAVVLPGDSVEVPLLDVDGHPAVTVTINGRGPFRLAVETGAARTLLSPSVVAALAGTYAGRLDMVDSLAVGTVRIHSLPVLVGPIAGPGERIQLDGLLGLNAFYDVLLTLDYPHRRVRFTQGALPPANGRDVLPLHVIRNSALYGFEIEVEAGGGTERHLALLDTQNGAGILTTPDSIGSVAYATPPRELGAVSGPSVGSQIRRVARLAGGIRVADVTFAKPLVTLAPMPPEVPQGWNIGWSVLQEFVLTIDQQNRRIRLVRAGKAIAPPPPEASTGLVVKMLEADTTAYTVASIVPGSDAERQGVRIGDRLLAFDGTPATLENFPAWRRHNRGKKPVHVVLRRGNETQQLVLTPHVIVR